MTLAIERRVLPSEFETRSDSTGKSVIVGYAYKFNSRSQNLGGFRENVLPGAGAESIAADDIRALKNHDPNLILGRNTAGTLRMTEDTTGLEYEIQADERISYVRDLLISLERGDVTQSSFGFESIEDTWGYDESDFPLRSLIKIRLYDVSPVTYPAYLASESGVSQRALNKALSLRTKEQPATWTPPNVDTFDSEALSLRARIASLRG